MEQIASRSATDRNIALDAAKLGFAIMVVCMHSYFLGELQNTFSLLLRNGLFRLAVPVFFCINGFYFYRAASNRQSLDWLKRLFYLYLFWSLFYSAYWFKLSGNLVQDIIDNINILGIGFWHLWYIVGSIGAAAVLLLIWTLSDYSKLALALCAYCLGASMMYIGNYQLLDQGFWGSLTTNVEMHKNFLLFAFPFFTLGFLINKHSVHRKIPFKYLCALAAASVLLVGLEAYANRSAPVDTFDSYLSLMLCCPAIFMLLLNIKIRGQSRNLSLLANGVYFIHPLFIMYLNAHYTLNYELLTLACVTGSLVAAAGLIKLGRRFRFVL